MESKWSQVARESVKAYYNTGTLNLGLMIAIAVSAVVLAVLGLAVVLYQRHAVALGLALITLVFGLNFWYLVEPAIRFAAGLEYVAFAVVCVTAPAACMALLLAFDAASAKCSQGAGPNGTGRRAIAGALTHVVSSLAESWPSIAGRAATAAEAAVA